MDKDDKFAYSPRSPSPSMMVSRPPNDMRSTLKRMFSGRKVCQRKRNGLWYQPCENRILEPAKTQEFVILPKHLNAARAQGLFEREA
jgi:hypothetical protein